MSAKRMSALALSALALTAVAATPAQAFGPFDGQVPRADQVQWYVMPRATLTPTAYEACNSQIKARIDANKLPQSNLLGGAGVYTKPYASYAEVYRAFGDLRCVGWLSTSLPSQSSSKAVWAVSVDQDTPSATSSVTADAQAGGLVVVPTHTTYGALVVQGSWSTLQTALGGHQDVTAITDVR